ncbi:MAG: response regulator [Gemmataceae bacterium]
MNQPELATFPTVCRHVLVVEDNADGRETLRTLLTMLGYRVDVAADGPDGVRVALDVRPDVALIDIGLPGIDGLEVARQIRAGLDRDIVLVACTAYGDDEMRGFVADADFDGYLVKPVILSDLLPWLLPFADRSAMPEFGRAGPPAR